MLKGYFEVRRLSWQKVIFAIAILLKELLYLEGVSRSDSACFSVGLVAFNLVLFASKGSF